jgi:hypothetical protein
LFDKSAPAPFLHLLDMGRIHQNRVARFQVRFCDGIKYLVKAGPQFFVRFSAPGLREKGVGNVIVIEIHCSQAVQ